MDISRLDYTAHVRTPKPLHTINPLHSTELVNPEFLRLQENLELYYAPTKILTFEDLTRQQVKEHLLSIYGDDVFCDILAGCIKRDYAGKEGLPVMTPKEAKNYFKKLNKRK